ncbi:uncharacterized protein LOC109285970 isoform X2 [Alligator mississippiensis]|uniref:uncharacterized protein LOC109285970 isoform X2 n=1 Tax=Alligator mississippiensis TaxID=8496 RepID=UPI002877D539|nr:uncharacterized protein LOC109285970 isoform X2 [Alligator mississippiensis]XP_059579942.1 uncharacterized protein LOC109285970 isoform X2 [Alligator mississippiensis]XP_059579943.1 uncharacterized protein LOC109285970 isoform X2 [Alligator mississippiensis]
MHANMAPGSNKLQCELVNTVPVSAQEGVLGQRLHGQLIGSAPVSQEGPQRVPRKPVADPRTSPTEVSAGPTAGGSPSLWPPVPKRPWAGSHGAPTSPTPQPTPPLVADLLLLVPSPRTVHRGPSCPCGFLSRCPRWHLCRHFPGSLTGGSRRLFSSSLIGGSCWLFPGYLTGIPAGSIPVPSPAFLPALPQLPHRQFQLALSLGSSSAPPLAPSSISLLLLGAVALPASAAPGAAAAYPAHGKGSVRVPGSGPGLPSRPRVLPQCTPSAFGAEFYFRRAAPLSDVTPLQLYESAAHEPCGWFPGLHAATTLTSCEA